jgi:hypothetical protein
MGLDESTVYTKVIWRYLQENEPERSIGLFTDYVGTTEMVMAIKDKEYVTKVCINYTSHLSVFQSQLAYLISPRVQL